MWQTIRARSVGLPKQPCVEAANTGFHTMIQAPAYVSNLPHLENSSLVNADLFCHF